MKKIPRRENAPIILQAVKRITGNDPKRTFTPSMVIKEINKMGYEIPNLTAEAHIIAATPNHKDVNRYHGYRNKYLWIKGSKLNAEFRMLNTNESNELIKDGMDISQGESLDYLPNEYDFEAAYRMIAQLGESVPIDTVLNVIETNITKVGLSLKKDWRMITEKNIEIWSKKL